MKQQVVSSQARAARPPGGIPPADWLRAISLMPDMAEQHQGGPVSQQADGSYRAEIAQPGYISGRALLFVLQPMPADTVRSN